MTLRKTAVVDYFFGTHMGPDLELSPRRGDQRWNYFAYPCVELDGKVYPPDISSKDGA